MPRHQPGRHQPGKHEPGAHQPGGAGAAGDPVPKVQNSTFQVIDFKTITTVYNAGAAKIPSYQFSNGRRFTQPGDREV